jgi:hypothetical protein
MRKKAKKSQGGGTNQESEDPDRQNKLCSIVKHEEYEQRLAAERE